MTKLTFTKFSSWGKTYSVQYEMIWLQILIHDIIILHCHIESRVDGWSSNVKTCCKYNSGICISQLYSMFLQIEKNVPVVVETVIRCQLWILSSTLTTINTWILPHGYWFCMNKLCIWAEFSVIWIACVLSPTGSISC